MMRGPMAAHSRRVRRPRLRAAVVFGWIGALAATSLWMSPSGTAATAPSTAGPGLTDSAMTRAGDGNFAGLKVTVGQTKDLINQVVSVTWTGGTPTRPSSVNASANYLQIMQCWGDDPAGPDRTQCQFGATLDTGLVGGQGNHATDRQVNYNPPTIDPKETILSTDGQNVGVPFDSVTDPKTPIRGIGGNQFFDANTTNDIPFARTRQDGTGQQFFELQAAREAPGLGCGTPLKASDGTTVGRSCWLVVVPRGDTEVNGDKVFPDGGGPNNALRNLVSSPLSQTNWDARIVFPLQFEPEGNVCPVGAVERRMIGQEAITEAVTRWQPVLCKSTGTVYGFSQVPDDAARRQLVSDDPSMVFTGQAVPPDSVPAKRSVVYAPVAVSGLAIAFDIERQSSFDATPQVAAQDGERLSTLNLTPRLVAKLLTQSYRYSIPDRSAAYLAGNQRDLTTDPDFLQYNPVFKELNFPNSFAIGNMVMPLGLSDLASELWTWIAADPEARAFMAGKPDPWGMTLNKNYDGTPLTLNSYPMSDLSCVKPGPDPTEVCALDERPLANDMHAGIRGVSRGDTGGKNGIDNTVTPPVLTKTPRQAQGQTALIGVADVATAARYGLPTAALRNSAGKFVTPTTSALLAGVTAMKPSEVPAVLRPDPTTASPTAYPLTAISYAATVPAAIDAAAGKDFAAFLRFAAGNAQQPGVAIGTLPFGYAPLPAKLRSQTVKAAALIESSAGKPTTVASPASGANPRASVRVRRPDSEFVGNGNDPDATSAENPAAVADSPAVAPAPAGSKAGAADPSSAGTPSPQRSLTLVGAATPATSAGAGGYVVLTLAVLAATGILIGPVYLRLARRLR
ncbi:MAG: hypothetical protein JWN95_1880 [Frankiales bacterium]|nr:hypothetical protein [Frankiales bacterium]